MRIVAVLSVLVLASAGCRSKEPEKAAEKPAEKPAVQALPALSPPHQDAMAMFVKSERCAPSTCGPVRCEKFSDGKTAELTSHIARCRWHDVRESGSSSVNRCAYVHFSEDAAGGGLKNMFLSKSSTSAECAPDPEFAKLVQTDLAYSGIVP